MDIKKLAAEGHTEEIERQLMDLDSEFNFKCRKCGKCCKHQDTILFNARDIFNIAKKLGKTPDAVIKEYAEIYIGAGSHIPVVHMVPHGRNEVCPFLENGLCSIHDSKPTVCALFPLGRVAVNRTALKGSPNNSDPEIEIKYMLNDINCGSGKQIHTVREWLARFGIPEEDEFFLLWSKLIARLHEVICDMEAHHASDVALEFMWNVIYHPLYRDYDTNKEFLPQFRKASETLFELCDEIAKSLKRMESSDSEK